MMQLIAVAPLAFIAGVVVGLGVSSRFRIVRRPDDEEDHHHD
jgi:hypothetical protein